MPRVYTIDNAKVTESLYHGQTSPSLPQIPNTKDQNQIHFYVSRIIRYGSQNKP